MCSTKMQEADLNAEIARVGGHYTVSSHLAPFPRYAWRIVGSLLILHTGLLRKYGTQTNARTCMYFDQGRGQCCGVESVSILISIESSHATSH